MIYLDYSATTPVDDRVIDSFVRVSKDYIGNANSLHKLGLESRKLMDEATEQVARIFKVTKKEVIFTSSASEANNLAIFGVLNYYKNRGKHILTTGLEHSSIIEALEYAKTLDYVIDIIPLNDDGLIDMASFKKMVTKDTILVSIALVSSEVGIRQNVNEIGLFLKDFPTTIFHVDGTQAVGKIPVSLEHIDLFTCSSHKFFGLKGVACLIKRQKIELIPMIHGGKSQSIYRSGTPALALIVSFAKALRLAVEDLNQKYDHVKKLNQTLISELEKIDGVVINSNENSIPHIINISIPGVKPETMLHALEEKEIYISTKTACSKDSSASTSLIALKKKEEIAASSIRISLSYLTTEEEIKTFISVFETCYQKLKLNRVK